MFLSIIVPVYNAESYLQQCLDSLLSQDIPKEDYEILCVNDGSRDGSLEILQQFARDAGNVTVIDKENGGVTTARNAGLEAARGEYIWFVDADDLLKPNILGTLRRKAAETDCDRLIVGGYQFDDVWTASEEALSAEGKLPVNVPWYDAVVWRSVLRRSFLKEHDLYFRYPGLTHGEDGLFMYECGLFAPKTAQIPDALYFYRVHSGSAETNFSPENQRKKLNAYLQVIRILQNYYGPGQQRNAATADKLMTFLWFSLYIAASLPRKAARAALEELKSMGLFPCRRLPECTVTKSYMTDREDFLGKAYDWLYLHQHTRAGFCLIRAALLPTRLKRRRAQRHTSPSGN